MPPLPFDLVIAADPSKRCTGMVAIDPRTEAVMDHASIETDTRDDCWLARKRANVVAFVAKHGADEKRTLFVIEQFDTGSFHLLGRGYSNPTAISQILRADGVVREAIEASIVRRRIAHRGQSDWSVLVSVDPKSWRAAEGIKPVKGDDGKKRTVTPPEYKPVIESHYRVRLGSPDEAAALACGMYALRRARVDACNLFGDEGNDGR